MDNFFSRDITLLVGLDRGQLLKDELGIHSYEDLLKHYPFRYEDKSILSTIAKLTSVSSTVRLQGYIRKLQKLDKGKKKIGSII